MNRDTYIHPWVVSWLGLDTHMYNQPEKKKRKLDFYIFDEGLCFLVD